MKRLTEKQRHARLEKNKNVKVGDKMYVLMISEGYFAGYYTYNFEKYCGSCDDLYSERLKIYKTKRSAEKAIENISMYTEDYANILEVEVTSICKYDGKIRLKELV